MPPYDQIPRRRWTTRMRNFCGSLYVFVPDKTNLELNDIGQMMFRAMNGSRSVAEIGALVAAEFDLPPEEVAPDVQEFAEDLAASDIIDLLPPTRTHTTA